MREIKLHDIGEGMTEGEVIHYLVSVGDEVKIDEPLVEVQTDKMVAELTAPCNGIVQEIMIKTGETVKVGTTLLLMLEKGKSVEHSSVPVEKEQPVSSQKTMDEKLIKIPQKRIIATPYTRKIARENDVKLEDIIPQDPSGRITEEDIHRYLKGEQNEAIQEASVQQERSVKKTMPDEIPFRGIRKKIAENMTKSLFTIPHVTHFDEVNMTELLKLRTQMKVSGNPVGIPAFLVKALVIALKEFPIFNAELDEKNEKILLKKEYHIGMAANTDSGLLVPVVKNAHKKTIMEIDAEIKALTKKAQEGRLGAADMQESTFTVSNVGPLGSIGATPIINYPETALIAFHKTKKVPLVNEHDEIVIGHVMTLSMAFDHRVADGATAIAFTNRFANLIENPHNLMLELM